MQGMGGTMMAGGMQQRMAVGGNPGKDRHLLIFLMWVLCILKVGITNCFLLYLCHYKPHFVFFQLIFSEGSEVDVTTNSGTKSSTFFSFASVY